MFEVSAVFLPLLSFCNRSLKVQLSFRGSVEKPKAKQEGCVSKSSAKVS